MRKLSPIRIHPGTHRELKVLAAERGESLTATIAAMLRAVRQKGQAKGEK